LPETGGLFCKLLAKIHIRSAARPAVASKAISCGVGIPMIAVGGLMALLWAPAAADMSGTVEFVGSLIGILGVLFFIAGLFYTQEQVTVQGS